MKSDAYKGHLAMLGANILWGLMSPVSKAVLMAGPVSALSLTTFRMVGSGCRFLVSVILHQKRTCQPPRPCEVVLRRVTGNRTEPGGHSSSAFP